MDVSGDAVISPDGLYRYRLRRWWPSESESDKLASVVFIMLNPSTADASADDPTIRKCCGFARRLGYTGIDVVNLFAWRATKPQALKQAADPVGPLNDQHIREATSDWKSPVVAAWGQHGARYSRRVLQVVGLVGRAGRALQCISVTRDGQPGHPLMLPYRSVLRPWPETAREEGAAGG